MTHKQQWWILLLIILLFVVICSFFILFFNDLHQPTPERFQVLPISLHSAEDANYQVDQVARSNPVIALSIIANIIRDESYPGEDIDTRIATIFVILSEPVPTSTPAFSATPIPTGSSTKTEKSPSVTAPAEERTDREEDTPTIPTATGQELTSTTIPSKTLNPTPINSNTPEPTNTVSSQEIPEPTIKPNPTKKPLPSPRPTNTHRPTQRPSTTPKP